MKTRLTRRQALKLALYGSLGGLAAACAPDAPPLPTAAPALPTAPPPQPTPPSTALPQAAESALEPATPALEPAAPAAPASAVPALIAEIGAAASGFLAALDDSQRVQATYAFDDSERVRWHWTMPRGFPRNGVPLRQMNEAQRDLALGLLQASVSDFGFKQALDIISLQNDLGNDPELYYVTVFGDPGGAAPWGWRFEGHHLSRHVTVVGDQISVMPFFLGSWPTVNNAGLIAMEREEWAARELMASLAGAQRQAALFQERALGRHVTGNEAYVAPLDPVGVLAGDLNADQQALLLEIVQTYLGTLPGDLGPAHVAAVQAAGFENIRFGWAGAVEPRRPHYYRLQSPAFLLEYDNSRNGGTHIHSVWRDFALDFGAALV